MFRLVLSALFLMFAELVLAENAQLLTAAAATGRVYQVEALLAEGTDVNAKNSAGRPALVMAAFNGNHRTMILLLGAGADVNSVDEQGNSALMEASARGYIEAVSLLLVAGADVNLKNKAGRTALDRARAGKNSLIVAKLEEMGATEGGAE